ncbi:BgTH12-05610 [Blumeria graminis f. sp. triticale]|uniref:Bgt-2071 n=3 Tax=Blumeria graminis TaxID=34373 RepID=A0A061HM50_BLUGR|nr:hypothetical protein BGT96224_2071 [Blumeria graminis f. sp. tritici 96224]CAD6503866.1 BgTH12-05610 [Blumeria graminis f. sp. triticale]VDB90542.1 Bgt-2071 [Blumeria graminis f. sp. tritici]
MDREVEDFIAFTGASDQIARQYLGLTDNNSEQAIQLFFDSPDLASSLNHAPVESVSSIPSATRTQPKITGPKNLSNTNNLDNNDTMSVDNEDDEVIAISEKQFTAKEKSKTFDDDESIARRIQAQLYEGGDPKNLNDIDSVRAPLERRTEILVGGAEGDWQDNPMHASALQQMRVASSTRPGVFNQIPTPSIWDQGTSRGLGLGIVSGGVSETSKAARLAELFRPPFELMRQVPWNIARDQGKEEEKWMLVNVQDQSIFDCQQLNRDIWKNDGIKEIIKENFIFVQYSKDDPRGAQYIQYYFQNKDSGAAYPHIAIVDPRTGEQVKVWSGRPVPQAPDFLMQLYEFLDRYSLDINKKNPVANRKPIDSLTHGIDRLTEEQMLDLALLNSLANCAAPVHTETDPDDLTKLPGIVQKGKGKESEHTQAESSSLNPPKPFFLIPSDQPHIEPEMGPGATRIQFKHSDGRIVRVFRVDEPVRRIYEWLKSEPIESKEGIEFELKGMGKDLINHLDQSIGECGLKNGTVMVEFLQSDD